MLRRGSRFQTHNSGAIYKVKNFLSRLIRLSHYKFSLVLVLAVAVMLSPLMYVPSLYNSSLTSASQSNNVTDNTNATASASDLKAITASLSKSNQANKQSNGKQIINKGNTDNNPISSATPTNVSHPQMTSTSPKVTNTQPTTSNTQTQPINQTPNDQYGIYVIVNGGQRESCANPDTIVGTISSNSGAYQYDIGFNTPEGYGGDYTLWTTNSGGYNYNYQFQLTDKNYNPAPNITMTMNWGSSSLNNGTFNTGSFTLYAINCSCVNPPFSSQSTDLKSMKGNSLTLPGSTYSQYIAPRRTIGIGKPGHGGSC